MVLDHPHPAFHPLSKLFIRLFGPFHIFPRPGIDAQPVSRIDKRRGSDFGASFQGDRFLHIGGRVTLSRWFGVFDLQYHMVGGCHGDGIVVEDHQDAIHAFLEKFPILPHLIGIQFVLFVIDIVHKHERIGLAIEELGREFFNVGSLQRLAGPVGPIYHRTSEQILHFALIKGDAFARFAEVHLDHLEGSAINLDFESLAKFIGTVSSHYIFSWFLKTLYQGVGSFLL